MKTQTVKLFDVPIHAVTMNETLEQIGSSIERKKQVHHVVVNAAKIIKMKSDSELRESVVGCDIINADGQSIVWASKLLGQPLPERVAGIDLMKHIVQMASQEGYKIFFFGAEESVVHKVVSKYEEKYSKEIIAGYRNGYFTDEEAPGIAKDIAASNADILFVAITSPKKEIFLHTYKNQLKNVSFIMGVGGSFDVVAGKVKRAPVWMQKWGLEWFYRVLQEPGRMWKRYLVTNTIFILLVIKSLVTQKKQLKGN